MLLCDTGPLVAAASRSDPHHAACVELLGATVAEGQTIVVPPTVIAEVGYMLGVRARNPEAEEQFVRTLNSPGFRVADLLPDDLERVADLLRQYRDFPLGLTDASVLALAERFRADRVATLDHRHFGAVRLRHVKQLRLLP
ncbi:MAG: PIN domain-containing protein [Bifidobacteriaceae bacterium]|jgi:predicted nucleic acid-binding protein|nr:PIN domain-containing protein [Bifidobacteriaceae bacterium]